MPSTTWRDDDGNWVITNREAPMCFRCMSAQNPSVKDTDVMMVRNEVRLELNLSTQKTEATCLTCKHVMYREVG